MCGVTFPHTWSTLPRWGEKNNKANLTTDWIEKVSIHVRTRPRRRRAYREEHRDLSILTASSRAKETLSGEPTAWSPGILDQAGELPLLSTSRYQDLWYHKKKPACLTMRQTGKGGEKIPLYSMRRASFKKESFQLKTHLFAALASQSLFFRKQPVCGPSGY